MMQVLVVDLSNAFAEERAFPLFVRLSLLKKKKKKVLGASFHSSNFKPVQANPAAERRALSTIFPNPSLFTPVPFLLLTQMFSYPSIEVVKINQAKPSK